MNELIKNISPYTRPFLQRLIPGVMFAAIASEFRLLDIGMDNIILDTIICFVLGSITLPMGAFVIRLFSPSNDETDEARMEYIQKIQYIFSSATGVFLALLICWIGDALSSIDTFENENKTYFYLGVIILGAIISVISFLIKMAKR